jgi:hypothetical protein
MGQSPDGVVVGTKILGPLSKAALDLGNADGRLQLAGNLLGDLVLQLSFRIG